MNTITLPDPKDGNPVELEIPEGCPHFFYAGSLQAPANAMFNPYAERDPDDDHSVWLDRPARLLPIIAAVAVCWWEAKYQQHTEISIQMEAEDEKDRIHRSGALSHSNECVRCLKRADAWRKFTARPEGI